MTALQINQVILSLNKKINLLPCFPSLADASLLINPPDFEDALLYEIALHHQMDYFITSNIKDFKRIKKNILPLMSAKEFNKLLMSSI